MDDCEIILGDALVELDRITEPVDAVITDPPYNISIVRRDWDKIEDYYLWCKTWAEKCLVHMKPGAYLISFGSPRTFHQLVSGIEDAGFDITDCIIWNKKTGFPPNWNIAKDFDARAGVKGEVVRVEHGKAPGKKIRDRSYCGRAYDTGVSAWSGRIEIRKPGSKLGKQWEGWGTALRPIYEPIVLAQKKFDGSFCENIEKYSVGGLNITKCSRRGFPDNIQEFKPVRNAEHPTTKPVDLMTWLVELVTVPGQLVLDPFTGSGSTAVACILSGRRFRGFEMENQWVDLAKARIDSASKQVKMDFF